MTITRQERTNHFQTKLEPTTIIQAGTTVLGEVVKQVQSHNVKSARSNTLDYVDTKESQDVEDAISLVILQKIVKVTVTNN